MKLLNLSPSLLWSVLGLVVVLSIVIPWKYRPSNKNDVVGTVRFVTLVGMLLNLVLVVCKLLGGVLFYSQALLADAVHSTSDMVTDIVVILGVRFWSAPPDLQHPYGHGRIETLISAFIGLALAAAGIFLGIDAVHSMYCGGEKIPRLPALVIALLSVVIKEFLYRWTRKKAIELHSTAMEANAWHHRSDAFSSIPVAAAIVISYFYPDLKFIDALGAVIVSAFILHAAWKIIAGSLLELTDASVNEEHLNKIRILAGTIDGVRDVHAVRTRQLGTHAYVELHIMVDPDMTVHDGHALAHKVEDLLMHSDMGIGDVATHVEPYYDSASAPSQE